MLAYMVKYGIITEDVNGQKDFDFNYLKGEPL